MKLLEKLFNRRVFKIISKLVHSEESKAYKQRRGSLLDLLDQTQRKTYFQIFIGKRDNRYTYDGQK